MDHDYLEQVKEDLEKLLIDLNDANAEIPILVEGDNDIKALKLLGFEGEIIKINQGKPLFNLVEDLSKVYDEMIILMDWDRKGGQLARRLSDNFEANQMKYNLEFRKQMAYLCKKDIKDVQGLPRFLDNLEVKLASRAQDPAWDDKEKKSSE